MKATYCRLLTACLLIVAPGLLSACTGLASLRARSEETSIQSALMRDGAQENRPGSAGPLHQSSVQTMQHNAIVEPGAAGLDAIGSAPVDPHLASVSVSLNFVDTDVREFSRVLFAELLLSPYVVDQSVTGIITLRSGGTVDGNTAISMARQALEATGNTLKLTDGVYRVMSNASAGYASAGAMRTFPLRHLDAQAATGALAGILQGRAEIVSTSGSAVTVRGDAETLSLVESLLRVVDVDRFKAASFGLFPLGSAAAGEVAEELRSLYEGVGVAPQGIVPIERINAVLIVAARPEHLEFAQKWIGRLDRAPANGRQLYVYQVLNRDAAEVAELMQGVFGESTKPAPVFAAPEDSSVTGPGAFLGPPATDGEPRITADAGGNKLLIWARPDEYDLIDQALRRLDTPLDQVYVEATIAEVRLSGELSRGVRWFIESGGLSAGISDASNGAVGSSFPGFNFSFRAPQVHVVLSALESHTDVRIVSTPQLTVIDREQATIQVGDQVPIVTKTVQDTASGSNVIANDVTFRDTGVILHVTPQIRSSGEVLLDIEQEVSRVVPTTSSQINSPTISQRKVKSTVRVPDGTAIVLGGLISVSEEEGGGGFPGTQKTILESIFGSSRSSAARSELIVIIRPTIIRDNSDLKQVVEEIADKMKMVTQLPID